MFKGDGRLWIDRLGVRMDEPRERWHFTEDQVMTSVEYDGPMKEELAEFRLAMEDYMNYAKQCRNAVTQGIALPEIGADLTNYLKRKEPRNAKSRKTEAAASEEQQDS